MKRYFTLITLLIVSNFVNAAPQRFDFTFAENAGTARTTGFIVFESTLLQNPGGNLYNLPNPFILDLQVTVTGTAGGVGDGVFTLIDFIAVVFDTGGVALDFSRDLVGQTTDSSPWGTAGQVGKTAVVNGGGSADFVLLSNQQQPRKLGNAKIDNNTSSTQGFGIPPTATSTFTLGASGGSGANMVIVNFAPFNAAPIPSLNSYSVFIFGVLLLLIGFFTLRKRI